MFDIDHENAFLNKYKQVSQIFLQYLQLKHLMSFDHFHVKIIITKHFKIPLNMHLYNKTQNITYIYNFTSVRLIQAFLRDFRLC